MRGVIQGSMCIFGIIFWEKMFAGEFGDQGRARLSMHNIRCDCAENGRAYRDGCLC